MLNGTDRIILEKVQRLIPNNFFLELGLPRPQAWWKE
jgi:hypothetical protein